MKNESNEMNFKLSQEVTMDESFLDIEFDSKIEAMELTDFYLGERL